MSYWWQAGGLPPRRPALPARAEADVCIVGAGYTGLWTAYYLKRADPGLRVIVLEASFAGYGASGRNGGWVTATLPGSRARYAVQLCEGTPVTSISPGRARTPGGDVRAPYVLRCTEGFTAKLPGQHRTLLPVNSSMITTGPLNEQAWKSIGWDGYETLGDEAHAYIYAQRTPDGRIALGGRGIPYRFGSRLDHDGAIAPATATVTLDPETGLGWAGGHSGHGVAAANLAGRTLADLVRGVPSPLTALPWVGYRSPRWEPEPARWAGVHGLYGLYRTAGRVESARRSARTSVLARAGDLISGIPH